MWKKPLSYATRVLLFAIVLPIIVACGGAATEPEIVRETVIVESDPQVVQETVVIEVTPEAGADDAAATDAETTDEPDAETAATGPYTTPHPILSDIQVRQAIAHCTDRAQLVEAVYPYLTPDEQQGLLMDTFLTRDHWAFNPDVQTYPFDPAAGGALLDEAGWILDDGADVRVNEAGEPLAIDFLTTDAQFRQTWAAVFEQQMLENCGIQIIRTHAPAAFVFGSNSGLSRRDFELGAFAWVGDSDPGGTTLYACEQIPLPSNNWEGQNYMGWCNEEASRAIVAANSTLDREERIEQYGNVQREFAADMVSLPLFNRVAVAAATNNLLNYQPDPTEYHTANIEEWELADGGDTVIIGTTQEPDTLYLVTDSFAGTQALSFLFNSVSATTYSYDYQPGALTSLPTIENGGATLQEVEVTAGDIVWTTDAETAELAPGVEVLDASSNPVVYEDGTITMAQLEVTFEYVDGLTWEDGEPVKQADFELGLQITCDPDSGAVTFNLCDSRENVEFTSDTSYTVTYVPGALWPEYSVFTLGAVFPSHQVLSDGRTLADVPASEWPTLTEVTETPLSYGPYRVVEWQKGQRIIFEANPNYYKGEPAIQNVIVTFIPNTNQAVAQLLSGTIDVVGNLDLDGGAEVIPVLDAAEVGQLQAFQVASPTWEHIDMNLFIR